MRALEPLAVLTIAAAFILNASISESTAPAAKPQCEMVRDMFYLNASVDGSAPLWFNLDTGSSHSVIDPAIAKTLGLKESGYGQASGMGSGGDSRFGWTSARTIEIGADVLENQQLLTLSLNYLASQLGHATDGSLGSNVFYRYIVRTDYARGQVSLEPPATWRPSHQDVSFPIELRNNMPYIKAGLTLPEGKEIDGTFLIDSGMIGAAVSINRWVLQAHPELLSAHVLEMPPASSVGGTFRYRLTRLPALRIGKFILKNAIAVLPKYFSGVDADTRIVGLIGADVLRRFTVTFNYPQRQVFLAPNDQVNAPFETDMIGLKLIAHPPLFNRFEVDGVTPASPAEAAGIRIGDIIAAVDGRPAAVLTLAQLQEGFTDPGAIRHLLIQRGSRSLNVNLQLRRLI